jgi:predicted RNA-binding Zn ribbon-like protein
MARRADTDDDGRAQGESAFVFRGGHGALDLTATLASRLRDAPRERLLCADDLSRWFVEAGLADAPPAVDEDDLIAARRLREAIYDIAVAVCAGEAAPNAARLVLNRAALAASAAPQLRPSGDLRHVGDAPALLSTLARDAVRLFGGEDASRIRQCGGEGCAILFIDASRGGDRRWCSMAACGNRAKAAAFRRRRTE